MGNLPSTSGIYFVMLLGHELVSVNSDRPKIADQCIFVNDKNSKYGQAKNLNRRYLDYCRVFGNDRILFNVLVQTGNTQIYETALHKHFEKFRVKGRSGHLNEWIEGIEPQQALKEAIEICAKLHGHDSSSRVSTKETAKMLSKSLDSKALLISEYTSDDVVRWSEYLEEARFTVEHLRDLHHFTQRNQTFRSVRQYFSKSSFKLRGNNNLFAARLEHVVKAHQDGREGHAKMIADALNSFPHSQ